MRIQIGSKYIDDYGIVTGFDISSPKKKEIKQNVPGRDGELDLSESLTGFPVFGNRTIIIDISILDYNLISCRNKVNEIKNYLHGYKRDVVFPDDPNYYYQGAWEVDEKRVDPVRIDLSLKCDAKPYKLRLSETVVTKVLSDKPVELVCNNLRMPVIPKIEVTGATKLTFGKQEFSIDKGTHYLSMLLLPGENTIIATGTGTLTITYREGGL